MTDEKHFPWSDSYHSVKEMLGTTVYVKRLGHRLPKPKNWFKVYQQIQNFEPRIIEVYGVENNGMIYYMRYLKGDMLQNCMTDDYYLQMLDILNNIRIFNKNRKQKFYHGDAKIKNFMVEDDIVYLIDPDSFYFYNT